MPVGLTTAPCTSLASARPHLPDAWTRSELAVLRRLTTPERIQRFLDRLRYRSESYSRSPRTVLRERRAHCYDGALFAAAALRRLGHPPMLLDMRAVRDDDHVLAVFQRARHFGAVAKSNFVGLRFREPIFRTLRELVLSYFDDYFNALGEKTLRSYSTLLDLRCFDHLHWMFRDEPLEFISSRLDSARHTPLMNRKMIAGLCAVDERSLKAGMVGTVRAGLYGLATSKR